MIQNLDKFWFIVICLVMCVTIAPPPAVMTQEPTHASDESPLAMIIDKVLIFATPPSGNMKGELHTSNETPPIISNEPFLTASPPPTVFANEYCSSVTQPTDNKTLISSQVSDYEDAVSKYDLNQLQQLCPLADICLQDRNDDHKVRQKHSCCLSCKCDSMCKKMGTCCKMSQSHGSMCHMPLVEHGDETNRQQGYFMVDTCPYDPI